MEKRIVCFLIFIYSIQAFCIDIKLLDKPIDADKYLVDLPEPTPENLRWLLAVDQWPEKDRILAKGKYFAIGFNLRSKVNNGKGAPRLQFYTDKSMSPESYVFTHENQGIVDSNNILICSMRTTVKPYFPKVLGLCGSYHCEELESAESVQPLNYLKLKLLKNNDSYDICEYDLDNSLGFYDQKNKHFRLYRYKEVKEKERYVEISGSSGKSYFLNLDICKDKANVCGAIDIKYSAYEAMWVELKRKQEKKDSQVLNKLFKELGECVEIKNIPCVKKYMANKELVYCSSNNFNELCKKSKKLKDKSFPVTEDVLKELKACLKYERLLPHLKGSRGINKVCVFGDSYTRNENITDLILTYPESISENYFFKKNIDMNYKEGL